MPASLGWEKVRKLAQAILDSGFPALPLTEPRYGEPAYHLPFDNRVTLWVYLSATNGYFEGIQWKYAVECVPSDQKCEAIWKVAEEEFWRPFKTRYPWLPDAGALERYPWGYISTETPEGKRYSETSPIVVCYEYDIGKLTAHEECTPDYHWTEADEKKLKETIAREKAEQNPPANQKKP